MHIIYNHNEDDAPSQIKTEVAKLPQSRFLPRPPGHDLPLRVDVPKFQPRGSVEWLKQHGLKGQTCPSGRMMMIMISSMLV